MWHNLIPSALSLPAVCTSYVTCVQVTTVTEHLKLWLQQKWLIKIKLTLRIRKDKGKIKEKKFWTAYNISTVNTKKNKEDAEGL